MQTEGTKKHRTLIIAALFGLLLTRWMYYRLEIDAVISTLHFALEGVLFLLVYALGLLRVSPRVTGALLLLGCAGMGCLYGFSDAAGGADFLLPLTYLPLLLFFIEQNEAETKDEPSAVTKLLRSILYACPVLFAGLIVYAAFAKKVSLSAEFFYILLVDLLLCVVFDLIARTPLKKQGKTAARDKEASVKHMKLSFAAAMILIPETGLYLLLTGEKTLVHTLPVLWVVNLLLLFEQGHPLVCAFSARMQKWVTSFFSAAGASNAS